jgi:hypothetical protein
MRLQFSKNIAFTKITKTSGRPREFNFRRKMKTDGFEYDIDVSDERGRVALFPFAQRGREMDRPRTVSPGMDCGGAPAAACSH